MGYIADEWPDEYWNTIEGKRRAREFARQRDDELRLLEDENKLSIYKRIARDALMSWNGLSYEEATKKAQESSVEQLEQQVYAEGSIDSALKGFQKYSREINRFGVSNWSIEKFKEIIMTGKYINDYDKDEDDFEYATVGEFMKMFKETMHYNPPDKFVYTISDHDDMILSVLSNIHDGWVKDNQSKFMARDKKYQHMPMELIGWDEAKSDLLFLKPILTAMEIPYSDESLERSYNKRVRAFLQERGITDFSALREQISRGAEFYPALEGQEDIIQALQDPKFVEQVISGIKDKGIGTNKEFLQKLLGADKISIYKQIARDALMSWNGLSYEEATKTVLEKSNEELEQQVYAEGSIGYALKGIQEYSRVIDEHGISDWSIDKFKEIIMTGEEYVDSGIYEDVVIPTGEFIDDVMWMTRDDTFNKNDMILSVLSNIHDGWVKDNQSKFMARDKKHQHMPIELIGWNEAKSDLLFLKPILSAMKIKYSEKDLEEAYNRRAKTFLRERGITDVSALREQISRGAEFYPALEGQEDIIQALQNPEFVEEQVIRGIRDKGIGTNEQFLQQLFSEKTSENTQELEDLRDQKQQLEREAKLISEAEKLIAEKDGQDQNPDLDS